MLTIQAQVWQDCNINCSHCWRDAKFDKIKLDTDKLYDQLKSFLDKYSKYNDKIRISLTWWEIFLYFDRLKKLISLLDLYENVEIWLLTNGLLISDDHLLFLEKYKSKLIIQISIDWIWEIHDKIRWKWNFDKSIKTIMKLKNLWFIMKAQAVIGDFNYDNLIDLFKLFLKLRIELVWFRKMLPSWRWKDLLNDDLDYRKEKLYDFYNKILSISNNLNKNWKVWFWCDSVAAISGWPKYSKLLWTCWVHDKRVLWIEFNWDITLCSRLPIVIWNIYTDSLIEVYENNYLQKYFDIYKINEDCRKCEYLSFCKWGDLCEIYSYYNNLDWHKSLICKKNH